MYKCYSKLLLAIFISGCLFLISCAIENTNSDSAGIGTSKVEDDMKTEPGSSTSSLGNFVANELICLVQSEQEASELAELYSISLKSFTNGVAVFTTEEDLQTVIDRGKKKGWKELYKNGVYHALSQ